MRKYLFFSFIFVLFFTVTPTVSAQVCLNPLDETIETIDIGTAVGLEIATGTTETETNDVVGSCGGDDMPDVAFLWTAPYDGEYQIDTEGSYYNVLMYVLDSNSCSTAIELACSDNYASSTFISSVNITAVTGQQFIIVIDGYYDPAEGDPTFGKGAYDLNIELLHDLDEDGYVHVDYGGNDCNDSDRNVHPGVADVYNNEDDDCDGTVDEDKVDGDSDGYYDGYILDADCNDSDVTIHPNASEVVYDGIDQDCDGIDDFDMDNDGYGIDTVTTGYDCNDSDVTIHPNASEVVYDGIDQDCDGLTDEDDTFVLSSATPVAVPPDDASTPEVETTGTTSVTFTIDESYPITDIDLLLDITHTYLSDLQMRLISPQGTSVYLSYQILMSGEELNQIVFDDAAYRNIDDASTPASGAFQPVEPLALLNGEMSAGTWTLEIIDVGQADYGTLNEWALRMSVDTDEDNDTYFTTPMSGSDCDDHNAQVYPDATEILDGIDNNCDGVVDNIIEVPSDPPIETPVETPASENNTTVDANEPPPSNETPGENTENELPVENDESDDATTGTNTSKAETIFVTTLRPTKRGVRVWYSNDTSHVFKLFKRRGKKRTRLIIMNDRLAMVVHANGKHGVLFQYVKGKIRSRKKLSSLRAKNTRIKNVRIKKKRYIVVTAKKKRKMQASLSILRVKMKKKRLGKVRFMVLHHAKAKKIAPKKTRIHKRFIYLRNKHAHRLFRLKFKKTNRLFLLPKKRSS
ncbi:MAG: proprotein convertase P-domain-containing protein [Candidatus Kerfeldbacteria bacterium]|nr:proprotein convertase P-domain-containing protein [Candidatus Kerfeldbacteria bacterium]